VQVPASDPSPSALLDAAFEHAGVALCLVAPDGTILRINGEWLRCAGMEREAAIGCDLLDLFPEVRPMAAALHARARAGEVVDVPRYVTWIRGREVWCEGRIAPVPVEGGVALLVTTLDVTDEVIRQREAEAALLEREAFLRRVIDTAPSMVFVKDREGRFVLANEALARCYGTTTSGVIGKTDADFNPSPENVAAFRRDDLAVMNSRRPQRIAEEPVRHATGEIRWYETVKAPLVRDDGGCDEVLGIATDITDQKNVQEHLHETEQRFRFLADAMPQIVCVLAPDGTPEYVSPSWTEYSGLDLAATGRVGWPGVLHPDDVAAAAGCRRRLLERLAPQEVELRYRRADGTFRWFLSRIAPSVERGRVVRLIGAAMDIDDRKRAMQALRRSEEQIRASEQLLREEHRRKDEFLGMLSHELRNPLAPIRNSIYLLRHAGAVAADAALQVIERQTAHLTRLVDDLLDVTRIARGKIQLRREPLDVREVVRRTGEDFRFALEDRGVRLRVVLPEQRLAIEGDATRLAQVVGNLLHNAAKFTRRGDEVTVSAAREGGEVRVRVRDTGAGIDPAMLSGVFEPFVQSDRTLARTEGGLGLGLALVKGIVELHGGRVEAASAGVGAGAEFTVALPAVSSSASQVVKAPPVHRGRRRHVLVVDDNRDAAESMAQLVGVLGHEVEVAYDGESAVALARAGQPDTIFCDIGLPGANGYEVARQIRAFSPARLFALSGYAQPEDVSRALEAGFDAHVAKPADPARIEELLG
jgi:PAS domain S-box-containing protein